MRKKQHTTMQLLYLPKWSKLNKAGKAPIILRITLHSIRAALSTGLFTTRAGWNQDKEELRGTPDSVGLNNETLRLLKAEAISNKATLAKKIKKGKLTGPLTARLVADSLRTELEEPAAAPACALDVFTALIATHYASRNPHTHERLCAVLSLLRRWRPTLPVSLVEHPATGQALLDWCDAHSGRRESGKAALISDVQALWRRATGSTAALWPDLSRAQTRTVRRVRLTKEQLKLLRHAENLTPAQHVARLAYLLAFHLHGSRLGVVLELTWAQVAADVVAVDIEKGGGAAWVPINEPLRLVLERCRELGSATYVLPLLPDCYASLPAEKQYRIRKSKHACVHSALWYVAERLGLPQPLHPHTARHTAAKLITDAHGGDMRPANKLLRHTSMKMTELYVGSMSDDELNAAADKMYEDM